MVAQEIFHIQTNILIAQFLGFCVISLYFCLKCVFSRHFQGFWPAGLSSATETLSSN
jgi:hypothetical protein